MKFLVSVPADMSADGKWTTRREPVVPCFPSQHAGAFLSVPSFKLSECAEVAETDEDPDRLAELLAKEYPSLPAKLHENYVLGVFKAVYDDPVGRTYRVSVNQSQAVLIDKKTLYTKILWNEQPLE